MEISHEIIRRLLEAEAKNSHDPKTQTACIAIKDDMHMLGASNQFPKGVQRKEERLLGVNKHDYILHAEKNVIARAAACGFVLRGATLWMNSYPCADCAASIVQAGFRRLVADQEKYEARKADPRYKFAQAATILKEGGVKVDWL